MVEVFEQMSRSGEHGAAGGIEIFVEGYVNRVEQCCVGLRRYSGVGGSQEQPGAVQMQPDPALASECGDALHLGEVEHLAGDPAHRRFDRDRPDRRRDATLLGACHLGRHLGQAEGRALGRERDQGQPAELRHAIARVVVDMAFPLHQHPAAALREETQRQMVGERSAGQEDGAISLPSIAAMRSSS